MYDYTVASSLQDSRMGERQAAAGMPHLSSSHMRPPNISNIDLPGHDVGGCALNEALHCNAGAQVP